MSEAGWPTAAEIARVVGGVVRGDADRRLAGISTLESAGPDDLTFLHRPDMREAAEATAAACVIVGGRDALPGRLVIVAADPHRAYALAMRHFHPEARPAPGVARGAHVDDTASVAPTAHVGPGAVIGAGATVGERSVVHAGACVGAGCEVGDESVLHPCVVLYPGTAIGRRVTVHAGAVIGSDGFGYASGEEGHLKIPHVGRVVIEDDVEIGAGTCVDRAVLGETRIGAGTKIDNLVQVGHNVTVGAQSLLISQAGIAGSTTLGRRTILAGQAGVAGHLSLGDGVRVGAKSAVFADVAAGETVTGIPAMSHGRWKRVAVLLARLPEAFARLAHLEQRVGVGKAPESDE